MNKNSFWMIVLSALGLAAFFAYPEEVGYLLLFLVGFAAVVFAGLCGFLLIFAKGLQRGARRKQQETDWRRSDDPPFWREFGDGGAKQRQSQRSQQSHSEEARREQFRREAQRRAQEEVFARLMYEFLREALKRKQADSSWYQREDFYMRPPASRAKNYHQILGVSARATPAEIKAAFRARAKTCHPDLFRGDKAKEEQFKELNEAYQALGG